MTFAHLDDLYLAAAASLHQPLADAAQEQLQTTGSGRQVHAGISGEEISPLLRNGTASLGIANFLWALYVSDVVVDPAVAANADRQHLQHRYNALLQRISLHVARLRDPQSVRTESLSSELSAMRGDLEALGPIRVRERTSDISLLASLYRELDACQKQLLDAQRLANLVTSISRPGAESPKILSQLESLSSALRQVSARLKTRFAELDDLLQPILLALSLYTLGLDQLALSVRISMVPAAEKQAGTTLATLTAYPSAVMYDHFRSTETIATTLATQHTADRLEFMLTALSTIALRTDLCLLHAQDMSSVQFLYQQVLGEWQRIRAQKEDSASAAASIYRTRNDEDATQAELDDEEADFHRLFGETEEAREALPRAPTSNASLIITPAQTEALVQSHFSLFGLKVVESASKKRTRTSRLQQAMATRILLRNPADNFLNSCMNRVFRLDSLFQRLRTLTASVDSTAFEFYQQPNLTEAGHVLDRLQKLQARTLALLRVFPEQHLLDVLATKVESILNGPAALSPARCLSVLESVLPPMEDWEKVASMEHSLRTLQAGIIEHIISLRRRELTSWPTILEVEMAAFAGRAHEYWFNLYEVLSIVEHNASLTSSIPTACQTDYEALYRISDELMRSSPVGQFASRLALLDSFAQYARFQRLHVASNILAGVHAIYAEWNSAVQVYVEAESLKVRRSSVSGRAILISLLDCSRNSRADSAGKLERRQCACLKSQRS